MTRVAFEAVGLGRALVLSDYHGLRRRFRDAAIYSSNDEASMAASIQEALANQATLEEAGCRLRQGLQKEHEEGVARLQDAMRRDGVPRARRKQQRLLMITQHPYPWNPTLRRNVDALTETGAHLDLICSMFDPTLTDRPDNLHIHTIPIAHRRHHPSRYVIEYAAFFLRSFLKVTTLSLRRRFDAVQVDNVPDFLVFAAWPARLRGARIVFFMYELMPEMTMARLHLHASHPLVAVTRRFERRAVQWSDAVVVVNEACRRNLLARGVDPAKVTVIPNTQPPRPLPARPAKDRPTLVTHSTLIKRYGIDVAVRAFRELRSRWTDLSLLILGEGEELPALRELAQTLGVAKDVHFRGVLPWAEAMAEIRTCTVGLVPVVDDGYGQLLLPMKLLDYTALGVPAVCSRLTAVADYFPPDSLAYFAPGDASALAKQVDRLLSDPAGAQRQASRAREVALSIGWEKVLPQYLDIMAVRGNGRGRPRTT
ncbi:MAG: glycosyltransferase [Candidatus Dormibacteraeota bacterium]|nr:glycosyltransferase [Candidatus Dormibacteraeota bacterium]